MAKKWLLWLLLAATTGSADTLHYTYDDAGRLIRVNYGSGTVITYTYDAAGNLLSREVSAPAAGAASDRRSAGKNNKKAAGKRSSPGPASERHPSQEN